jgi:N-acetylglucosamine-6-sulfatase
MKTRSWLHLVARLFATVALPLAASGQRPNIVFIYADDMRWDTLGVVQREQGGAARFPWLQTPRLDRLAEESVRFRESFVATSLCTPGRASVMTSRYGHHTGVIGNRAPLPLELVTFARLLRQSGYTTAYCGKWHFGSQRERPDYDFIATFVGQGRYFNCPLLVNGTEVRAEGWVDDATTDYAIRFVERQPKEKPFFLWLGFKSPHGPRGGENLPERVKSVYSGEKSRPTPNTRRTAIYLPERNRSSPELAIPQDSEAHRDFMRHVTAIDSAVGRLLDAIEREGRRENTLVIFTSDNGYYLGEHGLGDKRSAYDESLRVPLLIRLPGPPRRGQVNDAMTLDLDHGPTILDYAGAATLPGAQGRSLRPLLEGGTPADWRSAFFYEYFREQNFGTPTVLAVRTTTHKLIRYPGREDWTELFDLKRDPYETQNLAGNGELLRRLQATFDEQAAAVGFRWPDGYGPNGETPPEAPAAPKAKKKGGK